MTPFIEIRDLTVRFGEVVALRDVNLEIMEGESLGILGRSGSGKSVLLHVLRGVEPFENISGNVIYHVARCAKCNHVEPPSHAGQTCKCGGTFEAFDADFVSLGINDSKRRDISRRIAIMLQRTFALYGDERVIVNVMRAVEEASGEIGRAHV